MRWLTDFLRRQSADLRVRRLQATLAKLDTELADIEAWRDHCDTAESIITAERARVATALHLATRKAMP